MRKEFLLIFCFVFLLLPLIPQRIVDLEAMRGQPITVTIEGAVREPVTLTCPPYTELGELLDQVALLDDADLSPFSMTMIVKDHDVIQIPHFQETPRISINTASIEQLMQLPGVGQATAEKIVAYRAEHGLFQTLEDLMQVPGIKQKKWEALKEFICL
ncbi:ComEA family DNA-binding protein [Holdemania filiformis]|uniref:ComEA family DNA-binding protein n=1 Tax=Holdemania filiformis TaxID=61171 RepID=UPI00242C8BB8|nr:helix-hairpin-helix domain-containing protein [Holdemania filiformis]